MDRKKRVLPLFEIMLTLTLSTVTLIAENYATGIISIDLPANYHIAYSEHKKISSPIPGAKATMESSALFPTSTLSTTTILGVCRARPSKKLA